MPYKDPASALNPVPPWEQPTPSLSEGLGANSTVPLSRPQLHPSWSSVTHLTPEKGRAVRVRGVGGCLKVSDETVGSGDGGGL